MGWILADPTPRGGHCRKRANICPGVPETTETLKSGLDF